MGNCIKAARGIKRLTDISSLPVLDNNSFIKYEGSISKCGDNADWDWGMYTDENGEWVLMEVDGPGCIYNFTQHRYPTSAVPTFRFYFDNSATPQFEIKPSEFGVKYPFIKPLADKFVGPDDNGRGPIWVVRSFVPMEFTTHCKVTSDIKLEGADKALGQGGWGHITYHMYDSPEGLSTFSDKLDISAIAEKYSSPLSLECDTVKSVSAVSVPPASEKKLFDYNGEACITKIGIAVPYDADIFDSLRIKIKFDSEECVYAPFGTFFGCEYGKTPAAINTALLTADFINGFFENRYPMPFFQSCSISVENKSLKAVTINSAELCINTRLNYNKSAVGCFRSSEYYSKKANTPGKNSVIADIHGNGSMVYGVISGEDIACGCEGDVRVFTDGVRSPVLESDGSESWGSYGWGFVCPPQCNPFSAYNGVPNINDTWSELRLTFTDNYPFRDNLRFELEHGCQNDGGGFHSGQIFYYGTKATAIKKELEINTESYYYKSNGKHYIAENRFENGIHNDYLTLPAVADAAETVFSFDLPKEISAIILKRVCLQNTGKMEAEVYINGNRVSERNWFTPDSNEIYSFFEDEFIIPRKYFSDCDKAIIKIVSKSKNWNDCGYKISMI